MGYIVIEHNCTNRMYFIHADINGDSYPERAYMFYSEQDAIREYRNAYGLRGKHLTKVYI